MIRYVNLIIDNIDKIGNQTVIPFLTKILKLFRKKIDLLKIIFIDYFIIQNWFINSMIIITIFMNNDNNIKSALIGVLLTFNLINGYNYYLRFTEWKNIKRSLLSELHSFIIEYRMILQYHRFPYSNNKNIRKHIDLDIKESQGEIFGNYFNDDGSLLIKLFEDYKVLIKELSKSKYQIDDKHLDYFIESLKENNQRLNLSLVLLMGYFKDNINTLLSIQTINHHLTIMIRHHKDDVYKNFPDEFLDDNLDLIDNINKMIKLVTK
ncbi:hypothetical protein ALC152_08530 [Arcobacter sp. 15-2]|uniref:hypothetical protein n=1 Tax=Arcobacter sp. 15-2 TaxID=3374109 RepID=UPI00399D517E